MSDSPGRRGTPKFSLLSRRHEHCFDGTPSPAPKRGGQGKQGGHSPTHRGNPRNPKARLGVSFDIPSSPGASSPARSLSRAQPAPNKASVDYILYNPAEALAYSALATGEALSPTRKKGTSPAAARVHHPGVHPSRSPARLDDSLLSPHVTAMSGGPGLMDDNDDDDDDEYPRSIQRLASPHTLGVDMSVLNINLATTPHKFTWDGVLDRVVDGNDTSDSYISIDNTRDGQQSQHAEQSARHVVSTSQSTPRDQMPVPGGIDPGARLFLERVLGGVVTRAAHASVTAKMTKKETEARGISAAKEQSARTFAQYEELLRLADVNKRRLQEMFKQREADYKAELAQVADQASAHEHDAILLRVANQSLRSQHQILISQAEQARKDLEGVRREATQLQHQLDRVTRELGESQQQQSTGPVLAPAVQSVIDELVYERDAYHASCVELHAEVEASHLALETALSAHEQFSATVSGELLNTSTRYENELSSLRSVAGELREREHRARRALESSSPNARLTEENDTLSALVDGFVNDTGPTIERVSREQEHQRLVTRIDYLESENNRLTCALADEHAKEGGSQSTRAVLVAKNRVLQERAQAAEVAKAQAEGRVTQLEHDIIKLKNELSRAQEDVAVREEREEREARLGDSGPSAPVHMQVVEDPHAVDLLRQLQVQKQLATNQRTRHQAALREAEDKISALTRENAALSAQLGERNTHLIAAQTELEKEVRLVGTRDTELAALRGQLQHVTLQGRAELEVVRVALENANSRIRQLEQDKMDTISTHNTSAPIASSFGPRDTSYTHSSSSLPTRDTAAHATPGAASGSTYQRPAAQQEVIEQLVAERDALASTNATLSSSLSVCESELRLMTRTMQAMAQAHSSSG